jgi:hypothetical protein
MLCVCVQAWQGVLSALSGEDASFLEWAEGPCGRAAIAGELRALRMQAAESLVGELLGSAEGREGLLAAIQVGCGGCGGYFPVTYIYVKKLFYILHYIYYFFFSMYPTQKNHHIHHTI